MTQRASLITISAFSRPFQNPPLRYPFPYSCFVQDSSGFQVGFCCLCRHNAGCGLLSKVLGENWRKKSEHPHVMLCNFMEKEKTFGKLTELCQIKKQISPKKKIAPEPTPDVISMYLFFK